MVTVLYRLKSSGKWRRTLWRMYTELLHSGKFMTRYEAPSEFRFLCHLTPRSHFTEDCNISVEKKTTSNSQVFLVIVSIFKSIDGAAAHSQ